MNREHQTIVTSWIVAKYDLLGLIESIVWLHYEVMNRAKGTVWGIQFNSLTSFSSMCSKGRDQFIQEIFISLTHAETIQAQCTGYPPPHYGLWYRVEKHPSGRHRPGQICSPPIPSWSLLLSVQALFPLRLLRRSFC